MTARFTGRTVLVTGGGTGIGRAVALAFAREGARVVVAGRREEPLKETVRQMEAAGGEAVAITADVTRAADVRNLVERTVERFGGLDVAVNNVGMLIAPAKVADIDEDDWDRIMDTNLKGIWLSMKYEICHMREHGGGAIVNIASNLGAHMRRPGFGAYAAGKAAVSALTRNAALDHIGDGVRINAVSPGPVETPMSSRPGESSPEKAERMRRDVPVGRAGAPDEIAAAVLHLASDEAGYTVGADLVLDGGVTA
ncbi:short-chain dehydrogenase [Streptomyces eurocidicus]|uniref:NAD(P)-dependent dehydrogenase (Short-subunit alcohol dehydrogenase family) n=1 Tax=Streptomyces eurocidicus TaxID=66423 RepID=A0A2N8NV36_STREU|nr:glucose 1-dehydrogenase [Streptomyces eurocidicus]MBB5122469.1 NAD(P)-dependent dehydrogenase (short-subunit alcohol dehydrogenase family) [Streptomyces eurocidicus]MBF6052124.1 glucose 1-dehydrogenase [Streptomyces eurocidicus]PNE32634.1 short-chain dehydrogenase [Streptomyces eurocidicus]